MRSLVTGVAGFVGSTLAERLIALGHDVVGVDRFSDYYPRSYKERNLAGLRESKRFSLVEGDVAALQLGPLFEGTDYVFHQAAQAGVRASWGNYFESYVRDNVLATQRLLEAAKAHRPKKFVYASSSSVYGQTPDLPMRESSLPKPFSPYGVTKLGAEHLCELYRNNFDVASVSLRYFTVYGPRQRPDMGFHRFVEAILDGREIAVFGDGEQTRDFTFVADAVEANFQAATREGVVGVFNIGGGSRVSLNHVLSTLGEIMGTEPKLKRGATEPGDVRHTWADTTAAQEKLGFAPRVSLRDGLAAQAKWHAERRSQ